MNQVQLSQAVTKIKQKQIFKQLDKMSVHAPSLTSSMSELQLRQSAHFGVFHWKSSEVGNSHIVMNDILTMPNSRYLFLHN